MNSDHVTPCVVQAPDKKEVDNPVWEELSPMVWRTAVYSDEAISNCMGDLFQRQVDFFESVMDGVRASGKYEKIALVEVGMGTAELFSRIHESADMLVGVELS